MRASPAKGTFNVLGALGNAGAIGNSGNDCARIALMPSKRKPKPKPKLTDAERHKHFVEVAREVGTSGILEEFDKAFKKIARPKNARRRAN